MYDSSKELLSHAETLELQEGRPQTQEAETLPRKETERLMVISKAQRRKRMMLFNSEYGVKIRLNFGGHAPKKGAIMYWVLCVQNEYTWRWHRKYYLCFVCSVQLCIRTYWVLYKSWWSLWNSEKALEIRETPLPQDRSLEDITIQEGTGDVKKDSEEEDGHRSSRGASMELPLKSRSASKRLHSRSNAEVCGETGERTGKERPRERRRTWREKK